MQKKMFLFLAILLVVLLAGCARTILVAREAISRTGATPTKIALLPTPTTSAEIVVLTPIVDTSNSLEAQVAAVYNAVSASVVHIRARSITYDFFLNPIPQEGTGSGFV